MNGTYGFVYCGIAGVGLGIFRVVDSALVGVDLGGARYKRLFVEDKENGEVTLSFSMTVPTGSFLVNGVSAQDLPYTKHASAKLAAGFAEGKPFDVYIPPGTVTMMVRRIPDDFSLYADGVTIDIRPVR